MKNPYQTSSCRILKIEKESSDSLLFTLSLPYKGFTFESGQFVQVSLPGFGEAPISLCSDPCRDNLQICVRKAGLLTSALHQKKTGERIGIRGPYGRGFPLELIKKRNLLIIAGGCGIEPLRPLIFQILNNPQLFKEIQLFYGSRSEEDLLFSREYGQWKKNLDFNLSLDKAQEAEKEKWHCETGVVTNLFNQVKIIKDGLAFLCGPPVMYKFAIKELLNHNFKEEDIYLSLERRMHCGIGVCQHCAVGSKYVCHDGPVFNYREIKEIYRAV